MSFGYGTADGITDDLDLITNVQSPSGTDRATYRYMGTGRRIGRGLGNGIVTNYDDGSGGTITGLDRWGRVLDISYKLSGVDVLAYGYGYDARGNRTRQDIDFHIADQDWTYAYDGLSRLVNATRGTFNTPGSFLASPVPEATTWNLDGVGNWSGDTTSSQSVQRFLDANTPQPNGLFDVGETFVDGSHHVVGADNEIDTHITLDSNQTATSQPFFYDDAGNLVFDGQRFYVYDAFNRLTLIHDPGTLYVDTTQTPHVLAGATGAALVRFEYDALGRRVLTIETPSGTPTTTRHAYGTGAGVLAEYDVASGGTETLQRWFIHGQSFPDPLVLVDLTGAGGGTAGTAQYFYYLKDALGSVGSLTDATGAEVELYTYTPYGQTTIYTSAGTPLTASAYGNPFAWTGQRYDAHNELYHFWARSYDPRTGRFLQEDMLGVLGTLDVSLWSGGAPGASAPAGTAGSEYTGILNLFLFVSANPTNGTDPFGLVAYGDALLANTYGAEIDAGMAISYGGVLAYVQGVVGAAAAASYATSVMVISAGAMMAGGLDPAAMSALIDELSRFSQWSSDASEPVRASFEQAVQSGGQNLDPKDWRQYLQKVAKHAGEYFGKPFEKLSPKELEEWARVVDYVDRNTTTFRWSSGAQETVARVARYRNGPWVCVQRYMNGDFCTAFVVKGQTLSRMLARLSGKG